jgi:hypothetical protein
VLIAKLFLIMIERERVHNHFYISSLVQRFLNNIVDTNEPTSAAVKMHRALFDDSDSNKAKSNSVGNEAFSISRNLVQRKHELVEGNNMEINRTFDVNTKLAIGIDSISLADNMKKFNHSTMTSDSRKKTLGKTEKLGIPGNVIPPQSFGDVFKSTFRCKRKINEQIQSDYPLNLHLRMNEIFSMHDKLSEVAEKFNGDYAPFNGDVIYEFHFVSLLLQICILLVEFSWNFLDCEREGKFFIHSEQIQFLTFSRPEKL